MKLSAITITLLLTLFYPALFAQELAEAPGQEAAEATENKQEKSGEDKELEALKKQVQRLSAMNAVRDAQVESELKDQLIEIMRIETDYKLKKQKLQLEMAEAEIEGNRLSADLKLVELRQKQENQELTAENARQKLEMEAVMQELQMELAEANAEKQRLAMERELQEERFKAEIAEIQKEQQRLAAENLKMREVISRTEIEIKGRELELKDAELELKRIQVTAQTEMVGIDLAVKKLNADKLKLDGELAKLKRDIERRSQEEAWLKQIGVKPEYTEQPFVDGVLTISDRRIPLNDVIMTGSADFVTKRIHYFNNESKTLPIFIVIDRCPGGSVMEGYRIVKAMEASEAPVHVVVKSFAASMAAVITTLADHSYAYPNAVILHHQPSGGNYGNLTQQQEQVETLKEWARRLMVPIAEKMGLRSEDEFYKQMYENNSEGDWDEFADEAVQLKWVDNVVTEIREEGILKMPTDEAPRPSFWFIFGKDGEQAAPADEPQHIRLPRPEPFDFYFLHDPYEIYRW